MNYTIIDEPKYRNKVVVLLEGLTSEDEYETLEQVFSKKEFDEEASQELICILELCHNQDILLCDVKSEIYNIQYCNLNDCPTLSGYEVNYYNEVGICYPIVMIL